MKKCLCALLCVCLLACTALLGGCGSTSQNKRLSVVTTMFPIYDWLRQITGTDNHTIEITLLDSSVDPHGYQPTAEDIVRIGQCDLFVFFGGTSDAWARELLAKTDNTGRMHIALLDALGPAVLPEETAQGMQTDPDENTDEPDEHVWLSLRLAQQMCRRIADALGELDPIERTAYNANAELYLARLRALDSRFIAALDDAPQHTILVADRFPFLYLARDYDLTYYAAFSGCSTESQASFQTIDFLAKKADALGLHAILQLEGADGKLAQTIRDAAKTVDPLILTMDSMQSAASADMQDDASYLAIMEQNLQTLQTALSS